MEKYKGFAIFTNCGIRKNGKPIQENYCGFNIYSIKEGKSIKIERGFSSEEEAIIEAKRQIDEAIEVAKEEGREE